MSEITSKPASQEYRDGWERVFGKKARPCPLCAFAENGERCAYCAPPVEVVLFSPDNALIRALREPCDECAAAERVNSKFPSAKAYCLTHRVCPEADR